MKGIKDFNFQGRRVLVRCDFNVPLGKEELLAKRTLSSSSEPSFPSEMKVLDDFRIKETLPTIKYLIEKGARVILMTHLGRPGGRVVENLRITPIQEKIIEHLGLPIAKAKDCIGLEVEKQVQEMQPGEILLLENLRFHKEEEEGDSGFAKELAKLGDIYINDAFGACHRAHASVVEITKHLPSGAGFLLEKEIKVLTELMESPQKPLVAVVGGAKVETKAGLINKISAVADFVLLGGLISKEMKEKGISLDCPEKIVKPLDDVEGKDIGRKTRELFRQKILLAKTVFFNGTLGMTEKEEFSLGTKAILQAIIDSQTFSVVGGGETVEFIQKLGLTDRFNHVSTGGGAMIAFLAGEKLPGIKALK
ncbi:MAG: phosphoglycerate kinase [bacterium]